MIQEQDFPAQKIVWWVKSDKCHWVSEGKQSLWAARLFLGGKRHLVPTPHLAAGEETIETLGVQKDWLLAAGKA